MRPRKNFLKFEKVENQTEVVFKKMTQNKSLINFKLQIPSKTFLLGEYSVLDDGAGLILLTEPSFLVSVSLDSFALSCDEEEYEEKLKRFNLHPQSPAGQFLKQDNFFQFVKEFSFFDPHFERGGFGRSSAEFVALYLVKNHNRSSLIQVLSSLEHFDRQDKKELFQTEVYQLLKQYERFSQFKEARPSGVDVLSQTFGCKVSLVCRSRGKVKGMEWPFQDLDFFIVATGQKIQTHTHLNEIKGHRFSLLKEVSEGAINAFCNGEKEKFLYGLRDFYESLKELNLVTKATQDLVTEFSQLNGIQSLKGCGALGADVLLLVFDKSAQTSILRYLHTKKLTVVSRSSNLSNGLIFC